MKAKKDIISDSNMAKCGKKQSFSLPNSEIISEWFFKDQPERLRKIFEAESERYGIYSKYEVYEVSG